MGCINSTEIIEIEDKEEFIKNFIKNELLKINVSKIKKEKIKNFNNYSVGNITITINSKTITFYFNHIFNLKAQLTRCEETSECCVCFEPTEIKTSCNHKVCRACCEKIVKYDIFKCPMCRNEMKLDNYKEVINIEKYSNWTCKITLI